MFILIQYGLVKQDLRFFCDFSEVMDPRSGLMGSIKERNADEHPAPDRARNGCARLQGDGRKVVAQAGQQAGPVALGLHPGTGLDGNGVRSTKKAREDFEEVLLVYGDMVNISSPKRPCRLFSGKK